MTPQEYRAALKAIGIGPTEFARRIGITPRVARRWLDDANRGPSARAAAVLRDLLEQRR